MADIRETVLLECPEYKKNPDACGCDVSECIQSIYKGLDSNSASPVDTWILNFKEGVTTRGIPIERGFMKWWIDPNSIIMRETAFRDIYQEIESYKDSLRGLDYEIAVYRDVIRPLIDSGVCPNFVGFLADGQNCSFENIGAFLGILPEDTSTEQSMLSMRRNLTYMRTGKSGRPSVLNPSNEEEVLIATERRKETWTYNFLITTAVPKDTMSLDEFVQDHRRRVDHSKGGRDNQELAKVVFQVLAGCYAMYMTHMNHNDLHEGNTFIVDTGENQRLTYIYGGEIYSFETPYMAQIFDFDRAFVARTVQVRMNDGCTKEHETNKEEKYNTNPLLDDDLLCEQVSQCNSSVPNADMVKVLCYLYKTRPDMKKVILECLIPQTLPANQRVLLEEKMTRTFLADGSCFFQDVETKEENKRLAMEQKMELGEEQSEEEEEEEEDLLSLGLEAYTELNGPDEILRLWGVAYGLMGNTKDIIAGPHTYACNHAMFDKETGALNSKKASDPGIRHRLNSHIRRGERRVRRTHEKRI
jgi:hypothetical protein